MSHEFYNLDYSSNQAGSTKCLPSKDIKWLYKKILLHERLCTCSLKSLDSIQHIFLDFQLHVVLCKELLCYSPTITTIKTEWSSNLQIDISEATASALVASVLFCFNLKWLKSDIIFFIWLAFILLFYYVLVTCLCFILLHAFYWITDMSLKMIDGLTGSCCKFGKQC